MKICRGRIGLKSLLAAAVAVLTVAGAWACPVPQGADSAYHTLSRLVQKAPRLGVASTAGPATRRDPANASACEGGIADIYPCSNVDLLSHLPLSAIGGGEGSDIWGWTDPQTGKEYALIGKTNGTAFVDISDPENAQYLGMLPAYTSSSPWRDLKTYSDHVYIVSEAVGHGLQVFDLTQLRTVTTPQVFAATSHYAGFGSAHNIAINEQSGFAYAVGTRNSEDGCGGGLHMMDLSRPGAPEFAGCYAGDGYTHDAQCVTYSGPDTVYQGSEICFNYNEDTLTIVDVSNKAAPALLARMPYSGSSYTHQGWLTDDQVFLLLDDEGDELSFGHNTRTYIWDVSDLDNPQVLGSYLAPTPAIDHNLYIKGDFAYQANYRAGLRIIDLTNIAAGSLVQNGFFDIYPNNDSADFNGSWSVYPYFDSGVVIMSGIEQGLFVLQPTALEPGFMLSASQDNLAVCGDGKSSAFIAVDPVGSYTGEVALAASGAPAGATISFTPQLVSPPANSIVSASVAGAAAGVYPITITGQDGALQFDQPLTLEVSQVSPEQPQLLLPTSGASGISGIQTLYWSASEGAFSYDLQVATDTGFNDIVLSVAGTRQRYFTPPEALADNATYFWRVTANNACGSITSATGSFATTGSSCALYTSNDVPIDIPGASTGTVVSTISSDAAGTVVDVNVVGVQLTHTWINDIDLRLEGPVTSGTSRHPERPSVLIMAQICNNEDNLDVSFDDEAAPGPLPCPPTDGGTYQPTNPLAAFDGSSGTGDWNLLVTDNFVSDGGALDAWALEICTAPDALILDLDNDTVDDRIDNCTEVSNPAQRDTDNDGFGNMCDGDFNNDGIVDLIDVAIMRADFLLSGDLVTDLNGDSVVDLADIAMLRLTFLAAPGPSATAQ